MEIQTELRKRNFDVRDEKRKPKKKRAVYLLGLTLKAESSSSLLDDRTTFFLIDYPRHYTVLYYYLKISGLVARSSERFQIDVSILQDYGRGSIDVLLAEL